jgi:pantoate--beta-alanine ligase
VLAQEPLISSVDYISVGSRETMAELEAVGAQGAVLSVALRLGGVRLIDNIVLGPP